MNNETIILALISLAVLIISFFNDRKKTMAGIKIAWKKFIKILPPLALVVFGVSLVLYFIPESLITKYLSNGNKYINLLVASLFGSITMMPGFIAFPLGGILRQNNVPYMVISGFTSTLMMVGILTFPVERKYFGTKVAVFRNIICFLIALVVSLITGLFFRELFS